MAKHTVNKLLESREELDSPDYVAALMDLINALITDQEDQPAPTDRMW